MKIKNFIFFIIFITFGGNKLVFGACRASLCGFGEIEDLPTGEYTCHCYPGYKGPACDDLLSHFDNPCLQNPCWNSGQCASSGETAICICSPGFFGSDCRNRLPIEVVTHPPMPITTPFHIEEQCIGLCKNGASCKLTGSTFSCLCTQAFTGLTCETALAPVLDQCGDLCQNGGTCQVVPPIFSCSCTPDFTGLTCETSIPLCNRTSNPCRNGGTCQNNACSCAVGFIGEFCQNTTRTLSRGEIVVKNRGGYTAKVKITYVVNGKEEVIEKSIIGLGGSAKIQYDRQATNVTISVGAVLFGKDIFAEEITNSPQCYDIYGVLPNPKHTRATC